MSRMFTPQHIEHPVLKTFGEAALHVATLEEVVSFLEDMVGLFAEDQEAEHPPDESSASHHCNALESIELALDVVIAAFEEADASLESDLIEWLSRDPEHWPIFRLVVLDPWWTKSGRLRKDSPEWVRSLCSNAITAHFHHDLFGRRRVVNL